MLSEDVNRDTFQFMRRDTVTKTVERRQENYPLPQVAHLRLCHICLSVNFFTESAHCADSVLELQCPSVCLFCHRMHSFFLLLSLALRWPDQCPGLSLVSMGTDFVDYPHAINALNIAKLWQRRITLSKNMELKIINHPKVQYMLPLRKELRDNKRRHTEKYEIMNVNTQRRKSSAIPFMQDQLNKHNSEQQKWCKMDD